MRKYKNLITIFVYKTSLIKRKKSVFRILKIIFRLVHANINMNQNLINILINIMMNNVNKLKIVHNW